MQKPTRRGPLPIQDAIRAFLREAGLNTAPGDSQVFDAWTQAVGPELERRALPVRFRRGELTVEVNSAVHLQELKNFTGDGYRRKANERLGNETIRRLVFKLRS